MLDQMIRSSIQNRGLVILFFLVFLIWGCQEVFKMNVDVFPDLTAPTVTLVTEAHGYAPHEIEKAILLPLEATMAGATGVRRVRSHVSVGIAITWVEFQWDMDIYRARQIVSEKLQAVRNVTPEGIQPAMAPITSIMGEIYFLGLSAVQDDPMLVKSIADWQIRRRLLAIPGVAQVINMGGRTKQLQVILDPKSLRRYRINPLEVYMALKKASENAGAGFLLQGGQEYLIQLVGKQQGLEQLKKVVIRQKENRAIVLEDLATLRYGPALSRGEASVNASPSVLIAIQKQPGINTLQVTEKIERALDELESSIGSNLIMHRSLLRQADFISLAVTNVVHALRDGSLLVVLVIGFFLVSLRATFITVLAMPISMIMAILLLKFTGATINTMTLGGLAIAVGSLVDDAIIDVENVVRRLKLNRLLELSQRKSHFQVVFEGSKEIRAAIFFATLIIVLVFIPLFFLSGVEGRLLFPLGVAYVTSLLSSLLVALTLTPALCMYLLTRSAMVKEGLLITLLKRVYGPTLEWAMRHPSRVIGTTLALAGFAFYSGSGIGQSFLPAFQEGALTVSVVTLPGTSLSQSDQISKRVEEILLESKEVLTTARRTGRAEQDEHAMGINSSEIDVKLVGAIENKEGFLAQLRQKFSSLVGVNITIGQPISHRIDHMLSGTRANIAVKILGPDLRTLKDLGTKILSIIENIPGVVDASIEQESMAPAITIHLREDRLTLHQMHTAEVIENLEIILSGHGFSELVVENQRIPMVLKVLEDPPEDMEDLRELELVSPEGIIVPLRELAQVEWNQVPGAISRENGIRKKVVMCNVAERDLIGVVEEIKNLVQKQIILPQGYVIEYGGQFESAIEASRNLAFYTIITLVLIFTLLVLALRSSRDALLVFVNLPLALIGGVFGIIIYDNTLSIASIIGLIALFGIAARNGLMLVTHYQNLYVREGMRDPFELITRGSMERLAPILMTALASGLALVPLALAKGQPGSEIQTPMAYVILFGLFSSTILNMFILPILYFRFGRVCQKKKRATLD